MRKKDRERESGRERKDERVGRIERSPGELVKNGKG